MKSDATTLTFARDGSKNVRAELNSSGAVTAAFRYKSYRQLAQSTTSSPTYLGLASQLIDPSGLYYMRAHWYEPATGRFLTRDPAAADSSAPITRCIRARHIPPSHPVAIPRSGSSSLGLEFSIRIQRCDPTAEQGD